MPINPGEVKKFFISFKQLLPGLLNNANLILARAVQYFFNLSRRKVRIPFYVPAGDYPCLNFALLT